MRLARWLRLSISEHSQRELIARKMKIYGVKKIINVITCFYYPDLDRFEFKLTQKGRSGVLHRLQFDTSEFIREKTDQLGKKLLGMVDLMQSAASDDPVMVLRTEDESFSVFRPEVEDEGEEESDGGVEEVLEEEKDKFAKLTGQIAVIGVNKFLIGNVAKKIHDKIYFVSRRAQ